MKTCTGCRITKLIIYFGKDKTGKNGLNSKCKQCVSKIRNIYETKNRDKIKERKRLYYLENKYMFKARYKRNPKKAKNAHLKRTYGISLNEYNSMRHSQKLKCLGCFRTERQLRQCLYVDHCHKTKKVRGLLCRECNLVIGNANDNKKILKNLIKYLEAI